MGGGGVGGVEGHRFPLSRPASLPATFAETPGPRHGRLEGAAPTYLSLCVSCTWAPLEGPTYPHPKPPHRFLSWGPGNAGALPAPFRPPAGNSTHSTSDQWLRGSGLSKIGEGRSGRHRSSRGHPPGPKWIPSLQRGTGAAALAVHWPGAGRPQARGSPRCSPSPPIPAATPASFLPPQGQSPRLCGNLAWRGC